jgi:RHS repeat-associated protein
MGRGRFAQWLLASLVVATGLGACVAQTSTTEQVEQSASAISVPGIPCSARADALIANTGEVFSNSGSLVDSYQSSLGPYGGTNVGSSAAVQAAEAIVHNGGVIHGTQTPDVPAGLAVVPVPSGAINLPLGSKTPGVLNIETAAQSITLAPGTYVAENLTVGSPGSIKISPAGQVLIWITGTLNLGGDENLNGPPENLEFLVTSSDTANVNVNGVLSGFVYAPLSVVNIDSTFFGGAIGTTVNLNGGASVHFDQNSVCPAADAGSDAAHDAQADASVDVSVEASHDATVDADAESGVEAGREAAVDVSIDVAVDAADAGIDSGHEAAADASIDVSVETSVDAGQDAAADVAVDVSSDVTVDVGVDAPTCTTSSCSTGNPCSVDTCNADGACSHTPEPNGTSCSQGNLCFGSGACQSGTCLGTNPIVCTASDACHGVGLCNPSTGLCSNPAAANGTTCNDGNACTQTDVCTGGVCAGGNPVACAASDACHLAGTCDPTSGVCSTPPAPNGTACNDSNSCTQSDTCVAGACVGANPVACMASDQCHVAGTCDPTTGACSNPTEPDGTACNDNNACTQSDICLAGTCAGSNPVVCTATDACHGVGTCDPTSGVCSNPAIPCSDAGGGGATGGPDAGAEGGMDAGTDGGGGDAGTGPGIVSTIPTNLVNSASFLWADNPLINIVQVAVIRGRVLSNPNGSPVSGASVTILDHPESAATTASDGTFSIPVNGGAMGTVQVQASGFFTVQRQIPTRWHQYSVLDDIWLTPPDPNPTSVALGSANYQAAQGSTIANAQDVTNPATPSRTARILVPPNTNASFTYGPCAAGGACATGTCDASSNQCTGPAPATLTLRATEYTVGANGMASMPGPLPPSTAYTYAVELSADEAVSAGASGVSFTNPVAFYVENFLGFPPNTGAPVGYYDRFAGRWVPMPDGLVIQITSIQTGASSCGGFDVCAVIDATDQAILDLSPGELNQLALLYPSGAQLWRFTTPHFTGVDVNWPPAPPDLGGPPPPSPPGPPSPTLASPVDKPACGQGSIIECDNQILAQELPVAGTPFSLRYQSDRAAGRASSITIPIIGTSIPSQLLAASVVITVAGVSTKINYALDELQPNQTLTWTWNRLDAFGNTVQGAQTADVKVGYLFPAIYGSVPTTSGGLATFGAYAGASSGGGGGGGGSGGGGGVVFVPGSQRPLDFVYTFDRQLEIGVEDAQPLGLGGWTLGANHLYDSNARVFYGGDGTRRSIEGATSVIETVAGSACASRPSGDEGPALNAMFQGFAAGTTGLAAGPDGSYYVTDRLAVRRVDPSGTIHHFAGNGADSSPCTGSGCLAATSSVNPRSIAVGPDSSVYIASQIPGALVQRVDPQGNIAILAGSTSTTGCADGPLGTGTMGDPTGLAAAPDGSVLIADEGCGLRRIGTDGALRTLSGPNTNAAADTGSVANSNISPTAVAVAPDGTIYVADQIDGSSRVLRVDAQTGTIRDYVGSAASGEIVLGPPSATFDGLPATTIQLGLVAALSVASDGTLYVADYGSSAIWSVDPTGIAHIVAGGTTLNPPNTSGNDNGVSAQVGYVPQPVAVAVGPNGSVYVADFSCRVRTIGPTMPGYSAGPDGVIVNDIAAEDGSAVYGFDSAGRHIATFDPTTGAALLTFGYDPVTQQLSSVVDVNGNTTTISRSGSTVTITPPFGQPASQQTTLTLGETGHATAITDPAGNTTQCVYTNGLMTSLQTPAGFLHQFAYDGLGQLLTDEDPTGATQSLVRTATDGGTAPGVTYVSGENWNIALTSGAGHTTSHDVTTSTTGVITQTTISPSGATSTYSRSANDAVARTLADGTVTSTTMAPDPRFGMVGAFPAKATLATPSGLIETTTRTRTSVGSASAPTMLNESVTLNGVETSSSTYASAPTGGGTWTHISAAGRVRQETIDAQGRIVGISFPGSQLASTALSYAATGGRLSSVVATSEGTSRSWTTTDSPGLPGYVATTTDPMGNVTTFARRDNAGRPTNILLPDFSSNPKSQYSMSYDNDGNMTSLTVPPATSASSQHNFSSNSLDLLGVYTPPVDGLTSSQTSYAYNADKQIQSINIPVGTPAFQSVAFSYDAFGRLSSVLDPSSGVTRQLSYNTSDQVVMDSRSDGSTLAYTYDGFLRTSATLFGDVSASVSWTYDNFFRVANRSVNGGNTVVYSYDNDNLFTGTSSPPFSVTRDYKNAGRIAGSTLGSVTDASSYNGFGELTSYTASSSTTTQYQLSVTSRDLNGRITKMTEQVNGATHDWFLVYDSRGRLTSAARDLVTNTYTYDPNGNRLTLNGGGEWFYDSQDRLLSTADGTSFTYRNDGTATSKTNSVGTYGYVYDLGGFLQSVSLPSGNRVQYIADARDRRIAKSLIFGSNIISQQFVYDDQLRVAAELGNNGATVTSVFVYGAKSNVPDYMMQGGTTYRIISDWLGSVRLVVNASNGAVVQQLDYDEFGKVLPSSFDTTCALSAQCFPFQPFGFAGGLQDRDTGLVRFGARDYDPQVGRWISKDPIRFDGGDTDVYAYAGNDPVNGSDPSGLTWWESLGMLWDWVTGTGPAQQAFGPGSNQVTDMMNAPGVERARDFFNQKNGRSPACGGEPASQGVTNYGAGFGLSGLWNAGTNSTQQFVGSYTVDITPNPDGSYTFTLSNTTSVTSALYGVGPSWDRSSFGPFGNMSQTYSWTE